jgi:hypothetical protein
VILLTAGFFNPVQERDLEIVKEKKNHLEKEGFQAIKIIFSPHQGRYLKNAIDNYNRLKHPSARPKTFFSDEERTELLQKALDSYDFGTTPIEISEMALDAKIFLEPSLVLHIIERREGMQVIYVASEDDRDRCREEEKLECVPKSIQALYQAMLKTHQKTDKIWTEYSGHLLWGTHKNFST